MNFISFIRTNLLGSCCPVPYSPLKKEDDIGQEKIKEIFEKYSFSTRNVEHIEDWKSERIKKYAFDFIKDVENIPVTTSNIDDVQAQLKAVARTCERYRENLITAVNRSKIEKNLRLTLINALIMTYSLNG